MKKNIHTLLIGTSKTQIGDNYYVKGANITKFWGTLSKINNSFDGSEQTLKLLENGVLFNDVSSAKGGEEKKDKEIKAISVQEGFIKLESILNNNNLKRIGFIGKKAAELFFVRFINNIDIKEKDILFNNIFDEYGEQKWSLKINSNDVTCYVLRNTGRQWKKEPDDWFNFWKETFNK